MAKPEQKSDGADMPAVEGVASISAHQAFNSSDGSQFIQHRPC